MKTLNINSYVRIKLTPSGIEKLKEKPAVDEDGYCEMQLWEVMNIFGIYLNGSSINLPFELNIQIEDTQFENVEE